MKLTTSPQTPQTNFFQLIEKLALAELSGSDFRVAMVVLRKTAGWKKDNDWISYSQFEQLTGLPRKSVAKSLARLRLANILLVTKRKLPSYKLNSDTDSWVVTKRELVSFLSHTSYQKETHNKYYYNKYINSKELIGSGNLKFRKSKFKKKARKPSNQNEIVDTFLDYIREYNGGLSPVDRTEKLRRQRAWNCLQKLGVRNGMKTKEDLPIETRERINSFFKWLKHKGYKIEKMTSLQLHLNNFLENSDEKSK